VLLLQKRPVKPALEVQMPRIATLMLPVLLVGCHAKFKKNAPLIDQVRVEALTVGGPNVELGKVYVDAEEAGGLAALAGVAVNISQEIKEVNQEVRIAGAVNTDDIQDGLESGLVEALGEGPPFGSTEDSAHGDLLQLEIMQYGVHVPYLGAQASFTFDARARIYRGDGDRVYKKRMTCTGSLGDPNTVAVVFGTVNNVKALKEMSDAELNDAFIGMARYCGERFVLKMRKHAG